MALRNRTVSALSTMPLQLVSTYSTTALATVAGLEPARPITSDLNLAGWCHTKLGHTVILLYYIYILPEVLHEEILYNILPYPL